MGAAVRTAVIDHALEILVRTIRDIIWYGEDPPPPPPPGHAFSALLALCAVTGEFLSQRPVTRSFGVFFHLCLNKRLSKQSWGGWFETPSHSSCRHWNEALAESTLRSNNKSGRHWTDGICKCILQMHSLLRGYLHFDHVIVCNYFHKLHSFLPFDLSGRRGIVVACVCLSARLSVRSAVNFTLSARWLVTDMIWNHQICSKHASWDTLGWYWKWRSLTLTFKVILTILSQNFRRFGLSPQ